MKKLFICLSLSLVLLLTVFGAISCEKEPTEPVVLRLSIGAPAEHPGTKLVYDWAEKFNEAAGGGYIVKVFPGGTLASTLEQVNALRTGAIEMGDAASNFYAGESQAFGVMDVPFLFNNWDAQIEFSKHALEVLNSITQEKLNQKLLCAPIYGTKDIYTVDKPVKTLADWKGLLVAINTPIESDTVKALGGAPVLIDWVDELPSLQKGVINAGTITSPMGLYPMGYYDVIKYFTMGNMKGGLNFIAINLDVWKAMPNDIQNIMIETADDYAKNFTEAFRAGEQDSVKGLESEGVSVYYLPKEERDRWVEACRQVSENYWNSLPQDVAKKLKDSAASANSKFPLE